MWILDSKGNIEVDHDFERSGYGRGKLWLSVLELRQQLRESGCEGLL